MQSANLSFNIPLFKKQSRRFWPLWAGYSLLQVMLLPVAMKIVSMDHYYDEPLSLRFHNYMMDLTGEVSLVINFSVCLFVALALWSYLYNSRSVSMIHALPLTRGSLFLTNYVTGLIFLLSPCVLSFGLGLGVQALLGAIAIESLFIWLLVQVLMVVFFYSFATLLAFVTGHALALPAFYMIFNFLVKALTLLLDGLQHKIVFGYNSSGMSLLDTIGDYGSPVFGMSRCLNLVIPEDFVFTEQGGYPPMALADLGTMGIYAAVGIMFAVLAYLLYRHRRLELSGEVVVVGFLRPVFQYGVAVCGGLAGGVLLSFFFARMFDQSAVILVVLICLCTAIGYYVAAMLLQKSFRVFRKSTKGVLCIALLMVASTLAIEFDVSGYEKQLPTEGEILAIRITGRGSMDITDPEDVATVRGIHQQIIAEKDVIERRWQEAIQGNEREGNAITYFNIQYFMQDGSKEKGLERTYQIPMSQEDLAQEGSIATAYQELINRPKVVLDNLFRKDNTEQNLMDLRLNLPVGLTTAQLPANRPGMQVNPAVATDGTASVVFSGEAAKKVYRAVQEDVLAGRLGKSMVLDYQSPEYDKINCINGIYFSFRRDYNEGKPVERTYVGDVSKDEAHYEEVYLELQMTADKTLSVLQEYGILTNLHIISREVAETRAEAWYGQDDIEKEFGSTNDPAYREADVVETAMEPAPVSP